jgi:DNA invertase Pin-like site-specific DNA recombinase
MDSGVEFVAVDNPGANKLTIHILAAVAQHEREAIAKRTSEALQAARRRGKRLGAYGADVLAPANKAAAIARAEAMAPILIDMQGRGLSAKAMAMELNERKVATANGAKWHAQTVIRTLRRIQPNQA